jgi:hypothetical protein
MADNPEQAAHAAKNIEQKLQPLLREAQESGLSLTAAALEFALVVLADDVVRICGVTGES